MSASRDPHTVYVGTSTQPYCSVERIGIPAERSLGRPTVRIKAERPASGVLLFTESGARELRRILDEVLRDA